jgi:hypothetical protein
MKYNVIDNLLVKFYDANLRPEEQLFVEIPLIDIVRMMRLESTRKASIKSVLEKKYNTNLFASDLNYFAPTVATYNEQEAVFPRQNVYFAFRLSHPTWKYSTASVWRDRVFEWLGMDAHLAYVGPTGKEVYVIKKVRINKKKTDSSEITHYLHVAYLKTMKCLSDLEQDYPEWAEIKREQVQYLPLNYDKDLRVQGIIRK